MSEFLNPHIDHPSFNFIVNPDLGGTRYPFSKEILRDNIIYSIRDAYSLTQLEIPGDKSFLHVSVDTSKGDRFLDAYYNYLGDLMSANIWFRAYCDQKGLMEQGKPSKNTLDTYDQLSQRNADIMVEADMAFNDLGLYVCDEDSTADNLKILGSIGRDIPENGVLFTLYPDVDRKMKPITFYAKIEDNVLTLGFRPNKNFVAKDCISTVINMDKIYGNASPRDISNLLGSVFIKY